MSLSFRDALDAGMRRAGDGAVSALYPSSGDDTGPFSFLMPAFLQHRGIDMPTPDLFVYIDRAERGPLDSRPLFYVDHRNGQVVVETLSVDGLTLDNGLSAALLEVMLRSDLQAEERTYQVLRLQMDNESAYRMVSRAGFAPDVFIGVDDGCCAFGGNLRCENSLDINTSAFRFFSRPPRYWITDNFNPRPGGHVGVGDSVPADGLGLEVTKLGLLSSRWGHSWQPLFGATAFQVRCPGNVGKSRLLGTQSVAKGRKMAVMTTPGPGPLGMPTGISGGSATRRRLRP